MGTHTYPNHKEAALALLSSDQRISRKEAGFLGQIVFDPPPLSEKQAAWLAKLLERAELPQVVREVV